MKHQDNDNSRGLTRGQLVKATGCPPYLIAYYTQCGYLSVLRPSAGLGYPTLYHSDAVRVIQERQRKKRPRTGE